jgi:hypothetical protein
LKQKLFKLRQQYSRTDGCQSLAYHNSIKERFKPKFGALPCRKPAFARKFD